MTHLKRITATALAGLAVATPAATAMPTDPPVRPQTKTAVDAQTAAPDTCPSGSRAVHGVAGTGCTTSDSGSATELGVLGLVLAGAAAFGFAMRARPGAGRARGRASTAPAFSERTS